MAYDVFISCKSEDYGYGREVSHYLEDSGLRVFFCDISLARRGQAYYRKAIREALETATHLAVVTSSGKHVADGWVEMEWGTFHGELMSKHKSGNIVTIVVGDVSEQDLPIDLRQYEVVNWNRKNRQRLIGLLPGTKQIIFRIDTRRSSIAWARRPRTHDSLFKLSEKHCIDGDMRGNVVNVWASSYSESGKSRCAIAVDIITRQRKTAESAKVNLEGAVIMDANGRVLHRIE